MNTRRGCEQCEQCRNERDRLAGALREASEELRRLDPRCRRPGEVAWYVPRVSTFSDGSPMCEECCHGDRCDDPTHWRRKGPNVTHPCPWCDGMGHPKDDALADTPAPKQCEKCEAAESRAEEAEWAYRQLEKSAEEAGCTVTLHDGGAHPSGRRNPHVWNTHRDRLQGQVNAAEARAEKATHKALRFDLDQAGIERREAEAVELVDLRAQAAGLAGVVLGLLDQVAMPDDRHAECKKMAKDALAGKLG